MICEHNIKSKDFSIDLSILINKLKVISISMESVAKGEILLPDIYTFSSEEDPTINKINPVWAAIIFIEEIIDDLKVIGNALYPT